MKKWSSIVLALLALLCLVAPAWAQEETEYAEGEVVFVVNIDSVNVRDEQGYCVGYLLEGQPVIPTFRTDSESIRESWVGFNLPEDLETLFPDETAELAPRYWVFAGNLAPAGDWSDEDFAELTVPTYMVGNGNFANEVTLKTITLQNCGGTQPEAQPEPAPVETPAPQTQPQNVNNNSGGGGNGGGGGGNSNGGMCQYFTSWYHGTGDNANNPNDDHSVAAWKPLGQYPDWPIENYNAYTAYPPDVCSSHNGGVTYEQD